MRSVGRRRGGKESLQPVKELFIHVAKGEFDLYNLWSCFLLFLRLLFLGAFVRHRHDGIFRFRLFSRGLLGTFLLRLASLMGMSLERVATSLIDDTQHFKTLGWDLVPILFDQFDADQSGTISRHEISIALRSFDINATFSQLMSMMTEVDRNNDSELDQTGRFVPKRR